MKILMVSNLYPPDVIGGAEILAANLAGELAARGHDVRVLTAKLGKAEPDDELRDGVRIHRFWPGIRIFPEMHISRPRRMLHQVRVYRRDWHNARAVQAFRRVTVDVRPDVVHTHNLYGLSPSIWAEAHRAGTPVLHTAHDAYLLSPTGNLLCMDNTGVLPRVARGLHARRYMQCTRDIDIMCFPSNHHLEIHRRAGRAGAMELVPHGLSPAPAGIAAGKEKKEEGMGVLFLGQLDTHKGIVTLLNAAHRLDPPSGIRFGIAGRGRFEPEVAALAKERANVRFHGYVSGADRDALMRSYDVLVFPSLCLESFGLAVLEAMQRGLAVLVSDIGGPRELVDPGRDGILFEPGSSEALVAALRNLAASPEELDHMKRQALNKAKQFTLKRMVDAYETLYGNLVERLA